jgi:predicted DNA-binding transcriptional regulator AlpA
MAPKANKCVISEIHHLSERLLTPIEAAEILTLQASTLAEYRSQGKGPKFVRLSKNLVRYKLSDILNYIRSQQSVNPEEGVR